MNKTIAKSLFAGVLAMSVGCVTGEDFVLPPSKPLTVTHTEPQKPTSESNAKPDASVVAPVVDEAPKRIVKARDEKQPVPPAAVRKVALVVQNHADPGAEIPFMALTDALTAKLSGCGLQVINPYNAIGVNLNRTAAGEKMPEVSAMEIARKLKADGAITASVLEFLDSASDTTHQYSIRIVLNLADAWSGATVVEGETVEKSSPYYANDLVRRKKAKLLNDLMYAAAEECAARMKKNPKVKTWQPTPPHTKPLPKYPYEPLVLSDVEDAINVLRGKMLEDGKFNDRYSELFAQRGGSPVLTVGGINDLTKGKTPCVKLGEYADHAKDRLQTTLGRTHRFAIKDFAAVEELRPYIKNTDKDPLSDRSLLEALQRHLQPDLFVAGHIKYIAESGMGTYYIHLGAYDFLKGVVIWEDDVEVVKTQPKGDAK